MNKLIIAPKYLSDNVFERYKEQSFEFLDKDEFLKKMTFDTSLKNEFIAYNFLKKNKYQFLGKDITYDLISNLFKTAEYLKCNLNTSNITYIEIKNLLDILDNNQILVKDDIFKTFLPSMEVEVIGYKKDLDTDLFYLLDLYQIKYKLESITIPDIEKHIYFFKDYLYEVAYTVNDIANILSDSYLKPTEICIVCTSDYLECLEKINSYYGLPLDFESNLLARPIVKSLLKLNPNEIISYYKSLSENELQNAEDLLITRKLATSYLEVENYNFDNETLREYFKEVLKNHTISSKYKIAVVPSIKDIKVSSKKVYILGFNSNLNPSVTELPLLKLSEVDELTFYPDRLVQAEKLKKEIIDILNLNYEKTFISYSEGSYDLTFRPNGLIEDSKAKLTIGEKHNDSFGNYDGNRLFSSVKKFFYKEGVNPNESFLRLYLSLESYKFKLYDQKDDFAKSILDILELEQIFNTFSNAFIPSTSLINDKLDNNFSYSKIDNYFSCPFKYFLMTRVFNKLGYKTTYEIERGNLLHNQIERIVAILNNELAVDEYVPLLKDGLSKRDVYALQKLSEIEFIYKENFRYLKELSHRYNFESELKMTAKIKNTDIKLNGRIDLLLEDKYSHRKFILDLKTSAVKKYINEKFDSMGVKTQMPFYFMLESLNESKNEIIGGAFKDIFIKTDYQFTDLKPVSYVVHEADSTSFFEISQNSLYLGNGKISAKDKSSIESSVQEDADIVDDLINLIIKAKEEMNEGHFPISPYFAGKENACSLCPYKDICFVKTSDRRVLAEDDEEEEEQEDE